MAPTRIGRGTVIRGAITGDGDMEIDGRLEGTLGIDGNITIGDSGRIKAQGDVTANAISVRGAVAGSLRGLSAVVLEEGARVVGDLFAPTIGIRPGGLLRGHVSTGDSAAPKAVARPRAADRREPAREPARTSSAKAAPPTKAAHVPPPARVPATTRAGKTEPVAASAPATKGRRAAPAPVMPAPKKGQKGQLKKRNG